jgi:hypothetical protein
MDFAAMADLEDRHRSLDIVDHVDDAVVTLPNSVAIVVSGQLLAPLRARRFGKSLNSDGKALAVKLGGDQLFNADAMALRLTL